ncbi:sugar efflux transporter SetB [Actinokineospora globicatena]|uniref:Sugar efflux transporter SetB n=1 Tax=Actinokineospora globicatena TaxID=103729 RepID=A0A9W6V6C1_9PSEU|nr:sugar efflux transporter SetB [Actinokineospora globicatena]
MTGVASPPAPVRTPSLAPLATTAAAVGVAGALGVPFLPLFLTEEVTADPVALGGFLLAGPIASVLVSSLLGRLSDTRAIRRALMVGAGVAGAAGYGLYTITRDYWLLLALSITLVAASTSLISQVFAYAGLVLERSGSTRAPLIISTLRMLVSVSWVAGPPLAALLVSVAGFTGLFAAVAVCYALIAAVACLLPEPATEHHGERQDRPAPAAKRKLLFAVPAFALIQAAGALGIMALPLFVAAELGGTAADAGLVMGLCAALEIPLMLAFGALAVRTSQHRLVMVGMVVAVAYHAVMAATGAIWQVAVAQLLNAVVIAAVMGVGISYFQSLDPGRPGAVTALFGNTTVAGTMVAGPLLGLAQQIGYRDAYLMSMIMAAAGVLLLALARPSGKTRPSGQGGLGHRQRPVVGVEHRLGPERDGELTGAVPEPQLPHHRQTEPPE